MQSDAPTKLTPAQFRMLDKICLTNGGGVAVHTRDGALYR